MRVSEKGIYQYFAEMSAPSGELQKDIDCVREFFLSHEEVARALAEKIVTEDPQISLESLLLSVLATGFVYGLEFERKLWTEEVKKDLAPDAIPVESFTLRP